MRKFTVVAIKQQWWNEIFDPAFLSEHPKLKGICFFEFIKFEEDSWRDFTNFGGDQNMVSPLGNDGTAQAQLVLQAFRKDLQERIGSMVMWANKTEPKQPSKEGDDSGPPPAKNSVVVVEWMNAFMAALISWAVFA